MKRSTQKRSGFSLIEVALALLVVSVGLIAAIGMLPGSLDNSKKASEDTQQSLFADYVLGTIRSYSSNTNYSWSGAGGLPAFSSLPVYIPAPSMWDTSGNVTITEGSGTITFKPAGTTIEEMIIAYDLRFRDLNPTMKRARLQTWAVSRMNTNSFKEYYADFYRGDLQ
jgi:prepilin-type N-terminal cleavage/methylation domain-containing protein